MDTITQFALGAVVGDAGWGKRLGRAAPWIGGACGVLPDLDFILGAGDPWRSLVVHRAESHSLLVLPLVAVALGWAAWKWVATGREAPWVWMHLCLWALITHPLLDVFTAYGTQLLAPVSDRRFALDAMPIIDLVYTVPMMVAAVGALRKKRWLALPEDGVDAPGARGSAPAWRAWLGAEPGRLSRVVLVVTTLYLSWGWTQSQLAISRVSAAMEEEGFEAVAVRANPTLLNTLVYRVVGRDARGNLRIGLSSTFAGDDVPLVAVERPAHPAVDAALATAEGRIFAWFADGFLTIDVETRDDGRTIVHLADARYGSLVDLRQGLFRAEIELDAAYELVEARRVDRRDLDIGAELWTIARAAMGRLPSARELSGGK